MKTNVVISKNFSSLRVGGECEMVTLTNEDQIPEIIAYAKTKKCRLFVIGMGTNTFFNDTVKDVLLVKNEIKGIEFVPFGNSVHVRVGGGEIFDDVVTLSVEKGFWGIENLSYIPGTAGAAPVQNIGAYGTECKDVFVSLRAYDIQNSLFVEFLKDDCAFGYRDSVFKRESGRYIIISIVIALSITPKPVLTYKPLDTLLEKKDITVSEIRDLVIRTRIAKLPDWRTYPNAGSFFKNPVVSSVQGETLRASYPDIPLMEHGDMYKIPTAWLIEHVAEMKGMRIDNLGLWPMQPLVLVNYGNATAGEVISFSKQVIERIQEKTGIVLEREVCFVA
ncbi:MAG: UDP-N-acetylmuramate dehydrogenase [Candidatus Pacebacteria bacterium]|nr:UDP-N-acetylmuramate dehydrogenase [Candidatus Paceibacterota bacterium]MBP9866814.1 UDP-N-acetylmuramate dehydrogenase [Candidatus Paceibacterota bacterium]